MGHQLNQPSAAYSPVMQQLDPTPDPLELLSRFAALPRAVFLDGASDHPGLGRYSYLSADPVYSLDLPAREWPEARERLRATTRSSPSHNSQLPPFQGGWMGYLGYELGTALDRMPRAEREGSGLPDIALSLYDWVIAWDHVSGSAWLISTGIDADGIPDAKRAQARAAQVVEWLRAERVPVRRPAHLAAAEPMSGHASQAFELSPPGLCSDFTPDDYRGAVARVIEAIRSGELFQANITQRFTAPFRGDPLLLYRAMRRRAAAPMAAWIGHPRYQILSVSPELFLRFDPVTGTAESRPIKGTRPRSPAAEDDAALARALQESAKDRAENVMIVDLLRNDFARVCVAGSVHVPALCRLESHAAVHHLVSQVNGTLRDDCDGVDLIEATFPGGSITGAPKLRATELIARLEPVTRGVYCGAIGWIGCDGGVEFSIAIRTITLAGGVARIQAGGGITAQSDPDEEYRESLDKARALVAAVAETA
ncbi:MAG: aminodeoxychorismate synthase component I [Gemmatimonadota bacterium]